MPLAIACQFQGKLGQVVLDQIRTVDKARLIKNLGRIDRGTQKAVLNTLAEFFAE
ncbi:MAG: type II toxin-antitoxin system PemK/MazF family toxin [Microcoleaceae cyanobacterium]